jgi:hypothetical protein
MSPHGLGSFGDGGVLGLVEIPRLHDESQKKAPGGKVMNVCTKAHRFRGWDVEP